VHCDLEESAKRLLHIANNNKKTTCGLLALAGPPQQRDHHHTQGCPLFMDVVGLWHRWHHMVHQVRTMLISPANEVLLCPMITPLALDIKQ